MTRKTRQQQDEIHAEATAYWAQFAQKPAPVLNYIAATDENGEFDDFQARAVVARKKFKQEQGK